MAIARYYRLEGVRLAAEVRRGLKRCPSPAYSGASRVRLAAEVRRGLKPYIPFLLALSGSSPRC